MSVTFQLLDLTEKAQLNRVGWFFRREGEGMRCEPVLFDRDRWGECDAAIIAEENGEIVGVVTLASKGLGKSGRPTLDTLYVPKKCRKAGVGYSLFERGLRQLAERSSNGGVYCQLHSSIMLRLVDKLPTDLRSRLRVHEAFLSGDLADDFEYIEQDLPG